LLSKFRDIKAHLKKHKKLLGRREEKLAEKHKKKTPKYSLAPVLKDRYPSFVDALRDLDDALCLISLFAQFPQHLTLEIAKKDLETCQTLYRDFLLYCTISQCFTKSFFSIKGIYYRVEIMGQQITWVQPYKFNQRLPFDVDYKVMGTFTEFYIALLKFTNYKLFADLGVPYPVENFPVAQGAESGTGGQYFDVEKIQQFQTNARKLFDAANEDGETSVIDKAFQNTPEMQRLKRRMEASGKQRNLFGKCLFLLGRETPVYILQNLILSFGGSFVLQEEMPLDEKAHAEVMKKVTHMCHDRPLSSTEKGKEYVQPQYILDCINNLFLLPTKTYAPGIPPPAHLSPFIDNTEAGYLPDRQREINALAGIETLENLAEALSSDEEKEDEEAAKEAAAPMKGDLDSSDDEEANGDIESDSSDDKTGKTKSAKTKKVEKKKILSKADKTAQNEKIKRDLAKETQELGKMLMTNR